MLCQECVNRETCNQICDKLQRDLFKYTRGQRETTYKPVNDWFDADKNLPLDNIYFYISKWHISEISSYFNEECVDFPFLTPLQNKCLHLFYFEGLSYKQIAIKVKKSKTVVRGQIYRAKRIIRDLSSKKKGEISVDR